MAGRKLLSVLLEKSAKLVGVGLIVLFVYMLIGQGFLPWGEMKTASQLFWMGLCASLSGFLLLFRFPRFGAVISLLGIGFCYAVECSTSGKLPGGWVFPLFYYPGLAVFAARWIPKEAAKIPTSVQ